MNTSQLCKCISQSSLLRKHYGSVCPRDQLPTYIPVEERPRFYIVNTDPKCKPGKHWVLIFIGIRKVEFYDSLGRLPSFYHRSLKHFMLINGQSYTCLNVRLQSLVSKNCGQFCLYFAKLKCLGMSMRQIIRIFRGKSYCYNENVILDDFKSSYDI